MKIKRFFVSVIAKVDQSLGALENHDAVAKAAIDEIKVAKAQALVRVKKLREDSKKLAQQIESNRTNIELWQQRALSSAENNHEQALECLKRKRQCQKLVERLTEQYQEHSKITKQIELDIQTIELKVQDLEQKRNLMRTRESRASALSGGAEYTSSLAADLDQVFDAWEEKLAIHETHIPSSSTALDSLEEQFCSQEELNSLELELSNLTK
jgi:phage shock protein A